MFYYGNDHEWKITATGSRYLPDVDTRYAMEELKFIATITAKTMSTVLNGTATYSCHHELLAFKNNFQRKDLYERDND